MGRGFARTDRGELSPRARSGGPASRDRWRGEGRRLRARGHRGVARARIGGRALAGGELHRGGRGVARGGHQRTHPGDGGLPDPRRRGAARVPVDAGGAIAREPARTRPLARRRRAAAALPSQDRYRHGAPRNAGRGGRDRHGGRRGRAPGGRGAHDALCVFGRLQHGTHRPPGAGVQPALRPVAGGGRLAAVPAHVEHQPGCLRAARGLAQHGAAGARAVRLCFTGARRGPAAGCSRWRPRSPGKRAS